MRRPVVFIPEYIDPAGMDLLRAHCTCIAPWLDGTPGMDAPFGHPYRAPLYEADAVIIRVFRVTEADLRLTNKLRIVVKHGVGLDNVDIDAATANGVAVAYTPTGNTNAVAEHALGLMLALMRRTGEAEAALRADRFNSRNDFQGDELDGKTLGVIGLGRIGSSVAKKAAYGFNMGVLAFDPYVPATRYDGPARLVARLDDLLESADIVTLHTPLTPETQHILNGRTLAQVPRGCRIINTSRGGVIDQKALVALLKTGHLAGAALDVFEEEPLNPDDPLCSAPNVVLTPHIAGLTQASMRRTAQLAAQAVLEALQGRVPEHLVNDVTVQPLSP